MIQCIVCRTDVLFIQKDFDCRVYVIASTEFVAANSLSGITLKPIRSSFYHFFLPKKRRRNDVVKAENDCVENSGHLCEIPLYSLPLRADVSGARGDNDSVPLTRSKIGRCIFSMFLRFFAPMFFQTHMPVFSRSQTVCMCVDQCG